MVMRFRAHRSVRIAPCRAHALAADGRSTRDEPQTPVVQTDSAVCSGIARAVTRRRACPDRRGGRAARAARRAPQAPHFRLPRDRARKVRDSTTRSAARSASMAAISAPPVVTTSSTTSTRSPGLVDALDAALGAVVLGRLAHDQERDAAGQRGGGRQRHRAELRARPAARARGALARDLLAERLADRPEQRRVGLEAVLVEVDRRALARAQHEIAVQQRALGDAAARARRASPAGGCERLGGERQQPVGLGRALRQREHRAVLEVEVGAARVALALALEDQRRARGRSERERRRRRAPCAYAAPSPAPPCSCRRRPARRRSARRRRAARRARAAPT